MSTFTLHPQLENDSIFIADLALCQVRLENVRNFPWLILVPKRCNLTELHQLSTEESALLLSESKQCANALQQLFAIEKINVGALGNVVPQLHWHVVGRHKNDDVWPRPVWGFADTDPYTPCEIGQLVQQLSTALQLPNQQP